MKLQPHQPANTAALAVLVNIDRIRSSIKRLFRNNIAEIFGELFQNSQRAGATHVAIKITPDGFSVEDNGHGLLNGIEGFHTLLKLAESSFDNPTIEDQDPMGIGVASLLTHDQIEEVTFSSGNLQLTLDPERWWGDSTYYSTWFERVTETTDPVIGLRIYVRCKPELITALYQALEPKRSTLSSNIYDRCSPAQGYEGILRITLDDKPVSTALPAWATCREVLFKTKYQGNSITVGYDAEYTRQSTVLWYGQLIEIKASLGGFRFHLNVQHGRPVNPLSPSRAGIIQDDAYKALVEFVSDQIFKFVFNQKNRAKIKARHVDACFAINKDRALNESPYFTARQVKPIDDPQTFEEAYREGPEAVVFTYDEPPTLIQETVTVLLNGSEPLVHEYGVHSFVPLLENPHFLQNGNQTKLSIGEVYWQPGAKGKEFFYQPGKFGISYNQGPPTEWLDVTHQPVFAFTDPGTDLDYIDFIVGTNDPISFLTNEVWAGFCPSDDYDHDPQYDSFRESCERMIRALMGKCVPRDFSLHDLRAFLKPNEAVKLVTYRYLRGTFKKDGTVKEGACPIGITLQTSTGRNVKLKFY